MYIKSLFVLEAAAITDQETIAHKLMTINVFFRPNLSKMKPHSNAPIGHAIELIDANHDPSSCVKAIGSEEFVRNCKVTAGCPRPIPDDKTVIAATKLIIIYKENKVF